MDYDYREAMKLDNQLCFPLYAASRVVTGSYTPYLKELNLTYTQYIVMLVLWEQDGITVGDLCRRLMLDSGTLSPLIKKMSSLGYLVKQHSTEDERVVLIHLTEEGKALQEKAKDIPQQVGKCVKLEPEKAKQLYSLLYELLKANNDEF
ncbi:MAG: MarR family transcriptional regulator [Oscillospiraceae bacterium]|nr:MarR family transcriptional regulator [Oscillospiraceae bacterium]MBP1568094.1 MarR family transcriptional regulator [Oscillospiraceae bacterium]